MKRTVEIDRELALVGATARVKELLAEIERLHSIFPELRRGSAGSAASARNKTKRSFSAAAKRRMSAGMRKYWAKRRAAASGKGARVSASPPKA